MEALKVSQGSAALNAGTDKEKTFDELLLQEISQPQTVRYFFDYPKPSQVAPREMYEVQWDDGHVYGNVDELDPSNGETATAPLPNYTTDSFQRLLCVSGMVMRLLPHQQLPKVIVWCAHSTDNAQLTSPRRSQLRLQFCVTDACLPLCRMEAGEQREQYERSSFLPVSTENAERLKFYTAKPS
jgi:hypothetical protein